MQEPFHAEYLGEELEPYKLRFEAQNHEKEGDTKLYLPIHDLFKEVNQPDDAIWRERVEQYIDLPQFITHAAIEAFLAENDGLLGASGMNNFFLYRQPDTTRHRFLPWDKDNTFLVADFSIFQWSDDNILFRRAFAYPDLRELYTRCSSRRRVPQPRTTGSRSRSRRRRRRLRPPLKDDALKPFSTDAFYESVETIEAICPTALEARARAGRRGEETALTFGTYETIMVPLLLQTGLRSSAKTFTLPARRCARRDVTGVRRPVSVIANAAPEDR